MKILVTGGAGYIGSIVVEELLKDGYEVIALDNLQQGHEEAIVRGVEFIQADINDTMALSRLFQHQQIGAVMHMAAETAVEVSMTDPHRHFNDNVAGGLSLLGVMLKNNVQKLIFSSSAAIYGEPRKIPLTEDHPRNPVNAYGESKLIFENMLQWYGKAYNLKCISLRYFNAAGASELLGEDHYPETHLIPRVLKAALEQDEPVKIFGTDYPTADGSCIRDYVHVTDIARAHILALERLNIHSGKAYNLGNGDGYSVLDVVDAVKKVSGISLPAKICARRIGDPATLVASSELARKELRWKPQYTDLESIIGSNWRWMKAHPHGYSRNNVSLKLKSWLS